MNPRLIRTLAVVGALTFVAAACGDDDDAATPAITGAPAAADTAEDEAMQGDTSAEESETIVDVAVADGRFTTLVAAVEAAGLVETLSGDSLFTVFAPTDDAFAALPDGTLDDLLADPEALAGILTYHVVPGEVDAAAVAELDGEAVTTVNTDSVTVGVTEGGVTLTDSSGNTANVIITDVAADNGIIHVIDAVLIPAT